MSEIRTLAAKTLSKFQNDPLGFALNMFPWGRGPLVGASLEPWQIRHLEDMGKCLESGRHVMQATAGGHGNGKSALISILILHALTTMPLSRGQVTANKEDQVRTKTWPELRKWFDMFLLKDYFHVSATAIYCKEFPQRWRTDVAVWSDKNPSGYAGLHNKGYRTSQFIDEAAEIPSQIIDTALGALTDANTQHIINLFGNPTTLNTRFHKIFTQERNLWQTYNIDTRDVSFTNKDFIQSLIDQYGEDSDIIRVRVKGQFPRASLSSLFDEDIINDMFSPHDPVKDLFSPIVWGLDVATAGADSTCLVKRQGLNVFEIKRFHGISDTREISDIVIGDYHTAQNKPARIFVDAVGVGAGPHNDLKRVLGSDIARDVNGGRKVHGREFANTKTKLYYHVRDWARGGGRCIQDQRLMDDMRNINIFMDDNGRGLMAEPKKAMKARGLPSPDALDALSFTFAEPVYLQTNTENVMLNAVPSYEEVLGF